MLPVQEEYTNTSQLSEEFKCIEFDMVKLDFGVFDIVTRRTLEQY